MLYFLGIAEDVRDVFLGIASMIYYLLEQAAQLFFDVSVVELLDNATVSAIYQRVGLILGLFMLFKLTFSFIQMVVDPDQITDKNNGIGSVIKKLVVVVVLLGMTPTIFKWGFDLQEALIKDQTIGKIILGDQVKESGEIGRSFSANLYSSFVDDESKDEFQQGLLSNDESTRLNYGDIKDYMSDTSITGIGTALFCLIVGGIALWMFLTYTIATATRVVQLMFLELIAPIPIISYISSKKENAFQAWVKQCASTYLDLFIRMFIFYIAILMIQLIMSNDTGNSIYSTVGLGSPSSPMFLVYIMLILGVLLFMKKAPQLIEELFPGLKSKAALGFGIGTKEGAGKLASPVANLSRRATGAAIGAVGLSAIGGVSRLTSKAWADHKSGEKIPLRKRVGGLGKAFGTGVGAGTLRGLQGGFTAKKGVTGAYSKNTFGKVAADNKAFLRNEDNGYGLGDRVSDKMEDVFGTKGRQQRLKDRKFGYDQQKLAMDNIKTAQKAGADAGNDIWNEGKFMGANYDNSEAGRAIKRRGMQLKQLETELKAYSDPTSSLSLQVADAQRQKIATQAILNDPNESVEMKEEAKQELVRLNSIINRKATIEYEFTDGLKQFKKDAGSYAISEQAIKDGAQEQGAINIIANANANLEAHNLANKDNPTGQIHIDLTKMSVTDLDNFVKGKKEYEKISIDSSTGQIKNYNGVDVGFTVDPSTGKQIWNCKLDPETNIVYKTNQDGEFLKGPDGNKIVAYYNVEKNGTTIEHDSTVVASEIERQIKEIEMQINGNKRNGGK